MNQFSYKNNSEKPMFQCFVRCRVFVRLIPLMTIILLLTLRMIFINMNSEISQRFYLNNEYNHESILTLLKPLNNAAQSSKGGELPIHHKELLVIKGNGEMHEKYVNLDYIERMVPSNVSRFDFPWRIFHPISKGITLQESNNRFLYSTTISDVKAAGLGHSLLIINAEVQLARRLNITYTHRISRYTASKPCLVPDKSHRNCGPFDHAGAVEQLFGWGVGERPRSHVQLSTCPNRIFEESSTVCPICKYEMRSAKETVNNRYRNNSRDMYQHSIRVDKTVMIPLNLSFQHSHELPMHHETQLGEFIEQNQLPFTGFLMPSSRCRRLSVKYIHTMEERSYFFHKYWNAHSFNAPDQKQNVNSTFQDYLLEITRNRIIGPVGRRPRLKILHEGSINIAVHARRGDFFTVKRRMVSLRAFAYVIRQVIFRVVNESQRLADRTVSIVFYSEGRIKADNPFTIHDLSMMTNEFLDTDGQVVNESTAETLLNTNFDSLGTFLSGHLKVSFRIAENTIQSVHEMIAADIFIGSGSSLSTSAVGSISRAAFILLPGRYYNKNGTILLFDDTRKIKRHQDNGRMIVFDGATGSIRENEIETMKVLWLRFAEMHRHSFARD